jgi:hypothetical protein
LLNLDIIKHGRRAVFALSAVGRNAMTLEERLTNIVKAANPDDCDDVVIRTLLVAVLRDIAADLTEARHDPAACPRPTQVNLATERSGHRTIGMDNHAGETVPAQLTLN